MRLLENLQLHMWFAFVARVIFLLDACLAHFIDIYIGQFSTDFTHIESDRALSCIKMILGDSERGLWFLQDQAPTVWGLSQCQTPAVLVASPVPGSCPVHRLGAPNDQKLSLDPLQAASKQNIVGQGTSP